MYTQYRHLIISGSIGEPKPNEIAEIEQVLGVPLPPEFLDFLKVANGGEVEDYLVNCPAVLEEDVSFGRVFCTGRGDSHHREVFLDEHHSALQVFQTPNAVLPFGLGGGDAFFFLDLTPEGVGRVMVYLAGLPAWTGLRAENTFLEVAPSFQAFVDALAVDEASSISLLRGALARGDAEQVQANRDFLDLALPGWRTKYPELNASEE